MNEICSTYLVFIKFHFLWLGSPLSPSCARSLRICTCIYLPTSLVKVG